MSTSAEAGTAAGSCGFGVSRVVRKKQLR